MFGLVRQVDRLRDSVVGVLLECRLHPYVPLVLDLVSRYEYLLQVFWNSLNAMQSPRPANGVDEILGVEVSLSEGLFDKRVDKRKLTVLDLVIKRQRKDRLDSAGRVGNDTDRARRGYRRYRGVPNRSLVPVSAVSPNSGTVLAPLPDPATSRDPSSGIGSIT